MRAILFDWDGTIVDSIDHLFDAYAVVCRRFGLPFDREVFHSTFAPDWRLMYRQMGMPEERIEEAGRVWVEAFASQRVVPFPGVTDRLERLAAAGYALAVVTGGYHEVIWPQLERFGLARLFPVRVFGNDLIAGKPDPGPLLLALDRLNRLLAGRDSRANVLGPSDAAYVGDALDDMRMAAAAGVRAIGVTSILADTDDLRAAGADETISSVVEWIDTMLAMPRDAV